ncbi:Hsp70 family protein [Glycomyces buryatensis]|uniref:Hsp70 family protein n=1 Tax=Glycomyces buryatensis TaxID=2570927 RepID=UPI0014562EB8|nr:Hsp70 family protein [Glycomyces buryatensis]
MSDALSAAIRTARQGRPDELASVALAVPATWDSTRRRAHAEAAANAGFEGVVLVSEPEAAARFFAEMRDCEPDPGTPLLVYGLGAGSCNVGVVRREGDQYHVVAAGSDDGVGGREFDRLLLDYLASRYRTDNPEFWKREADPAETTLRETLLEEVRRAREHLTDHPTATVSLPGFGRELRLMRDEADESLTPAILQTVALIRDVMLEAGVGADQLAGLLLVGGASRTPLVASILRLHLRVEPILPEIPELVIAEGSALAALARPQSDASHPEVPPPTRLQPSPGVLVAILVLFIAVTAVIGVSLANRAPQDTDDPRVDTDSDDAAFPTYFDATGDASSSETDADGPESEETSTPPTSEPREEDGDDSATSAEPTPPGPVTTTGEEEEEEEEEAVASTGTVPDVVGDSIAAAKQELAEAGFTNVVAEGTRRTDQGPAYEDCEAIEQNPEAGTRRSFDDQITVSYVFVGNDEC